MPDLDSLLQQGETLRNSPLDTPATVYARLLQSGVPPNVAASIANNPSYGEGEMRDQIGAPPMPYQGQRVDPTSPSYEDLHKLWRLTDPSFRRRGAQDVSYQPGASAMAGGWGNPGGGPGMGGGLTPDMLKRIQLYQMLMQNRGAGGMAANPLTQAAQQMNPQMGQVAGQMGQQAAQQPGGISPQMMQLLQFYLQNQANNMGPQQGGSMQGPPYPQGGGGVDLSTLLGTLGFPTR